MSSEILGVWGVLAGWDSHQSKVHPRPPNTSQYNVCSSGRCLATSPIPSYGPHFDPPFGRLGWPQAGGVRKLYQWKSRHYIPIRFLYTQKAYLAPFDHIAQRGRQMTDEAIETGRLCYCIGGLKELQRRRPSEKH